MGLTGTFRGLSITEMLQLIRMARKTGALRIRLADGAQQSLFVRSGQVIGVESGRESLGPILLEQRAVSEEDLNAAIQVQKTGGRDRSLEQILLDAGKVTQESLIQALMIQAERMVSSLIQERGGQVNFEEGAEPELKLEIAMDLQSILMAAAVKADHDQRDRGLEHDSTALYARSAAGAQAFRNRTMELWLDDWKVFLALDGVRPLRLVAEKIKMAADQLSACVTTLLERGYIEQKVPQDQRKTVLIVDDSLTIQKLVEMALERERLNLLTASTGEAAMKSIEEHRPDLILLDIMLPDTNGYRLCQRIRGQAGRLASIPIIMLTARDSPQDESLGRHVGASAYMTKPFSPDALRQTVRQALTQRAGDASDGDNPRD